MSLKILLYMLLVLVISIGLFFMVHSQKRVVVLLGYIGIVLFALVIVDGWRIFDTEYLSFSEDIWKATLYDLFGFGAFFLFFLFFNAWAKDTEEKRKKEAELKAKEEEESRHRVIDVTVRMEKDTESEE